ncbi:protein of unknown function [Pseudorhizobium banfieldiae]|uniref:Uncharacterized protein n=1 Tax=Pseudorhizobium banfieldiae TaxID=1125847 RepID=L0NEI5_9HYPH|nr:protein of unknown function [Pseudorhizobium banfieldiae]
MPGFFVSGYLAITCAIVTISQHLFARVSQWIMGGEFVHFPPQTGSSDKRESGRPRGRGA